MFNRARQLSGTFSFFEFRLDTLAEPEAAVDELQKFLSDHAQARAIATCRKANNGGQFAGTAVQEAHVLRLAAEAGAHIVDLSIESAEELSRDMPLELEALRNGPAAVMLSWHDFQGTPDLFAVFERMRVLQPDLYKIVPTASSLRESFRIVELLQRHGTSGTLVAMGMGTAGVLTRILGPRYGSLFTFGSSEPGSETAPGQISSQTLRDLYRMDHIDAATATYGVFGKPIGGSRSPAMLNTAFATCGKNAVYLPLECSDPEELFECVERLQLAGASVTMPLKEQIVPGLPHMSGLASDLGAANTLAIRDGSLHGENTDAAGILQPLQARMELQDARVLVLGAGGAARAAVHVLRRHGAKVSICNRTHGRAEELARESGATAVMRASLANESYDVILNATPYGMANQQMAAPIDEHEMNCRIFFDMVYNPLETPLVRIARSKQIAVIPGIEMFVTQGAAQFELWTGEAAPVDAMQAAVLNSLQLA